MVRKITKWHAIIPFLCNYQRHTILADLERELGVPHQTIKKYADILVKGKILLKETKPKNVLYSLNTENRMVMNYLASAEKIVLEEALDRSVLLKRLYEVLSPYMEDTTFILFGSSAGEGVGEDLDLLAIGRKSAKDTAVEFEKTFGRRVHLVQSRDYPVGKTLLKEVIGKHIIFNDFERTIQIFWEATWKK